MSFIPFQQRCIDCKATWNTMFGMVGNSMLGPPCIECPHCKSTRVVHHKDGWQMHFPEHELPGQITYDQLWGEYT